MAQRAMMAKSTLGWLALAIWMATSFLGWGLPTAWSATAQVAPTAGDVPPPAAVDPEHDDHDDEETEVGKVARPVQRHLVREELLLDVSGIRDHAHLRFLKDKIKLALPENTVLYERRISRGRVVFAVKTQMELAELRQLVGGLSSPEMGGFSIMDTKGNQLLVKVQPQEGPAK